MCLLKKYSCILFLFYFFQPGFIKAQSLLDLLEEENQNTTETEYISATFKGTRLINGHTIETCGKNEMIFIISHRFGEINQGVYEFFGLDQSTIRLGLEYGINDRLDIGIGRSNYQKLYDGFLKYKIFRQSTGEKKFPVTVTGLVSMAIKSEHWADETIDHKFLHRVYYCSNFLIARKFNSKLSLQLMSVFVHRNLVTYHDDQNNVFAIGIGSRYKITKRISINPEYFFLIPGKTAEDFTNSFSIGFDIETGGHVFQLHFTNSRGMYEKIFIAETTGDWLKGDILFGFNITRYFSLKTK